MRRACYGFTTKVVSVKVPKAAIAVLNGHLNGRFPQPRGSSSRELRDILVGFSVRQGSFLGKEGDFFHIQAPKILRNSHKDGPFVIAAIA